MNNNFIKQRKFRQWLLMPIALITIAFGWKYRWISFIVPIVMVLGIGSLLFHRGRYFCGNFCPRGAFYDRILQPLSRKKRIPDFFRNKIFRWVMFFILFGVFILQAIKPPYTVAHFGLMFWIMCTVTTILGVILGIFFSQRTWCVFCPIGTLISSVGKDEHPLSFEKSVCIGCKLCEKVCPLNIPILANSSSGYLDNRDCIKCMSCTAVCPKKALHIS